PTITNTPQFSNTPNPSASAMPVPCLSFRFVAHVTYALGATVPPSSVFYKSWQVQNTGTCTWNGEYALVYDGGFQLGGASPLPLGSGVSVAPGQFVTLTIQLWSNPQPGTYSGTWLLQDADGNTFGSGPNQDIPLEVRIFVPGDPTPEFTSPASTAPPFYTVTPTP
ncbi:MAG: NBR1-Ig-like domain-containing protein, partial [Anaerolineales bacterium]